MASLEAYSSFEELKACRVKRNLTDKEELRQTEVALDIAAIKPVRKYSI